MPAMDFRQLTGSVLKFDYTYICSPVIDLQFNMITDNSPSCGAPEDLNTSYTYVGGIFFTTTL